MYICQNSKTSFMRPFFFTITFLFFIVSFSQPQDQVSMTWTLKGKILDSLSKQPLEYCTVIVYSLRDSTLITGGITDAEGNFSITIPRPGRFKVKISFLGYATRTISPVQYLPREQSTPLVDLGLIYLSSNSKKLGEVVVEDTKPVMELQLDKKVVKVSEDITTQGGTALDVLKNVPGVEVDQNGNISLRGSENVLVLIDGRPSTFTGADRRAALEQIQATNIENIEIITNPSAKYNPEGMTGIINLVLKKKKGAGFNSLLTLGGGYPTNARSSLSLSYSTNTYTIFGNIDGNYRKGYHFGENERTSYFLQDEYFLQQAFLDTSYDKKVTAKVGGEYYFSKKWVVGASATFFLNQSNSKENAISYYLNPNREETKRFTNRDLDWRKGHNIEWALNFSKHFDKANEELTGDFSFGHMKGCDSSLNRLTFWESEQVSSKYLPTWRILDNSMKQNIFNEKINWKHVFSDSLFLESGVESSLRTIDYTNLNYLYNFYTSIWDFNDTTSYKGLYDERIAALYSVLNWQWRKLSISGGIRAEYAQTNVRLKDSSDNLNIYRTFYPTGAISYTFNKKNQVQLTYSKRVNRPSFFNLLPFSDYSSFPNIRKGNPYLKPEYVHSFELSYAYYAPWGTFVPSVFYKQVYDVISRYRQSIHDTVFIMTWMNYNTATSTGIEATFSGRFLKWWGFNLNGQYYWYHVNGENVETSITGDARGWSFKMNNSLRLPHNFDVQLTANYLGPRFMGQGTRQPFSMVNVGIRKSWLQNKVSFLINVMDVLKTHQFKLIFDQPTYKMIAKHWLKSPMIMGTLTWKLSGDYKPVEKRKRENDMQNNMDMDF